MNWQEVSDVFHTILEFPLLNLNKVHITVFNVVVLVLILLGTHLLIKFVKRIITRRLSSDMDRGSVLAFLQLVRYFAYILAIAITLESMGIRMSFLLASSAALLVGIGLGLQQVFYDIVSGIILLFEGTIRVGDIVEINTDLVGRVTYIGLRTSKIETRDGMYVIVPNSKFISGDVINWSHIHTNTRFKVTVGVAYGSDVRLVDKLLHQAANEHKSIAKAQPTLVRFNNFGDSSLDFELFFWTDETFTVENIKSDLRFRIDELFRENGVTIPFPQRDLHVKKDLL